MLAGLPIIVISHPDPTLRGLQGRIVRETRNILVVETPSGELKKVLKLNALFLLQLPSGEWVLVRGEKIRGTQPDRLRRVERVRGVKWLVREGKKHRYTWAQSTGEDM
nr:ribonuclease P protein subunit [Pyrofollis japonicus]